MPSIFFSSLQNKRIHTTYSVMTDCSWAVNQFVTIFYSVMVCITNVSKYYWIKSIINVQKVRLTYMRGQTMEISLEKNCSRLQGNWEIRCWQRILCSFWWITLLNYMYPAQRVSSRHRTHLISLFQIYFTLYTCMETQISANIIAELNKSFRIFHPHN